MACPSGNTSIGIQYGTAENDWLHRPLSWQVTLSYFLINATVQAQLTITAFCKLYEVGMRGMALIMGDHA